MTETAITYIGGPTAIIEYGTLRLLTDPTFDPPQTYSPKNGITHVKTAGPAISPEGLGHIDAALISHHHHGDNLDALGMELVKALPLVLSTTTAAAQLDGRVIGLEPWAKIQIRDVTITAVPALHGPPGSEGRGPVIGFVLQAPQKKSLYISGDNASLEYVGTIAELFGAIDIAVLFAGAARLPVAEGDLTMSSANAAKAAHILGSTTVVGLHTEDWTHLSETRDDFRAAFDGTGLYVETPRAQRIILD
jgi:L-ascorbate metabolism protein UlaG (beta-lactamase superfamily)